MPAFALSTHQVSNAPASGKGNDDDDDDVR